MPSARFISWYAVPLNGPRLPFDGSGALLYVTSHAPSRAKLSEGTAVGLSASNRAMASSIAARCASVQVSPLSVPATDRSRAVHAVEIADADADTDAGRRRGREVLVLAGAMRVGAANARDVDAAIAPRQWRVDLSTFLFGTGTRLLFLNPLEQPREALRRRRSEGPGCRRLPRSACPRTA